MSWTATLCVIPTEYFISPGTSNIDSGDYVWNIDSNGEINGDIYIEDSYGTLRILNYFIHHILCIT